MKYLKSILKAIFGKYVKTHEDDIAKANKGLKRVNTYLAEVAEESLAITEKADKVITNVQGEIGKLQSHIDKANELKEKANEALKVAEQISTEK